MDLKLFKKKKRKVYCAYVQFPSEWSTMAYQIPGTTDLPQCQVLVEKTSEVYPHISAYFTPNHRSFLVKRTLGPCYKVQRACSLPDLREAPCKSWVADENSPEHMTSVACSPLLLVRAKGREPGFHQETLKKSPRNSIHTYNVSLCVLNGHIFWVTGTCPQPR